MMLRSQWLGMTPLDRGSLEQRRHSHVTVKHGLLCCLKSLLGPVMCSVHYKRGVLRGEGLEDGLTPCKNLWTAH